MPPEEAAISTPGRRGPGPRGYGWCHRGPTADELAHQHLWRFWTKLPKDGHITIFDRTWYGRLMVERIEGFASEEQWKRAYQEINEFEEELERWGAVIIKFWLHFSKEEQLKRFRASPKHAGKAVENHRRGLAQPGKMGSVRDGGGRDDRLYLYRFRPLAHHRI